MNDVVMIIPGEFLDAIFGFCVFYVCVGTVFSFFGGLAHVIAEHERYIHHKNYQEQFNGRYVPPFSIPSRNAIIIIGVCIFIWPVIALILFKKLKVIS